MKLSFLLGATLAFSTPRLTAALPPTGPGPVGTVAVAKTEALRGRITLPNDDTLLFFPVAIGPPGALAAAPTKPVNTVAIGADEKLRATLTLANHNTLLFFPTLNSPDVRVVALQPNGQKAWESTLTKAQVAKVAKAGIVDLRDRTMTTIKPLLLTSAGSKAYVLERIVDDGGAAVGLPRHTLVVQQIDEAGHITARKFLVPAPAAKTDRYILTTFAEDGVVYVLIKEENKREETSQFFLERCELSTGKFTQTALDLPKPSPVKHAAEFYRDWVFGGLGAGQAYFLRAVKGDNPKADARETPIEFEVKRVGLDGRTTSSYLTALHKNLPAGTYAQGGTRYPHYVHAHVPDMQETSRAFYDVYDVSTGGNADFYVDAATGNCQFVGQYSDQLFDGRSSVGPSLGTFVQRYGPEGTLLKAVSTPYVGLAGFKPEQLKFSASGYLLANVLCNPETQDLTLSYWTKDHFVVSNYNAQLVAQPVQFVLHPKRKPEERIGSQHVSWSGPESLFSYAHGAVQQRLLVDALVASPIGLYRTVGQLVDRQITAANQQKSKQEYDYTVSPTGPASALVLEAPEEAGGQISVYAVQ